MEKKPYPSELQDRFIIRFPEGMRDRIAEVAKGNGRSMNAEIVARLEASFTPPSPSGLPPEFMAEIEALLDRKLGLVAVVDGAQGLSAGVLEQSSAEQARSKTKAGTGRLPSKSALS